MKRYKTSEGRGPLALKGFSGAFVIFFTGTWIASTVFFIEANIRKILSLKNKNKAIVI